ncbi:MAG TPA: glycosyltransferase family 4 protein [Terriglobales bacterium]|nr:glycosyltransferase family 4 protein [Terriglobales bacterium]
MKILYISQYFPPELAAPAVRVSELSHHWVTSGHEVTVLTGFPNHPTGVVHPEYRGKLRRLVFRECIEGVQVVRTWLWPKPNRKALGRMLNFVSFAVSAAISGLFFSRPDVLIATSPQLLVGLTGWWLARAKRVPFIFEVRDLWPESLAAVGMGSDQSLLHRALAMVANFLYRQSDEIVVVTPAFKQHLMKHWEVPAAKISVVPNGVETELFSPGKTNSSLKQGLGIEGKFIACYIGTMGMAHGLDTILETAAELKTAAPQILFLLVGEGAEKENIATRARSMGLSNVLIVDSQLREKIPSYICASDVCLVLLKNTPVFETVIPTKMLEYMSCGRPVILGVEGQAKKILQEAQAGVCIPPEDAKQLGQAVMRIAADKDLRKSLGDNGRRHVLKYFSRQHTASAYLDVCRKM